MTFLEECANRAPQLEFYGRYDGTCPIDPDILRWFLDFHSPSIRCRLVPKWLHAKVIWWEGEGAYIGSANLTDRAWNKNYEAGVFFLDSELAHFGFDAQLSNFFEHSSQEIRSRFRRVYKAQKALYDKLEGKAK